MLNTTSRVHRIPYSGKRWQRENFGEFSYLDYLGEKTLANGRLFHAPPTEMAVVCLARAVILRKGGGRHKQKYHNYIS